VSPQNPLKPIAGMVPFAERLEAALRVAAAGRRIRVSDIEAGLGSTYTADTLRALRRRFPRTRFVWLMGGDNLAQLPYWKRWQDIVRSVPFAVFDRPGTSSLGIGLRALAGKAAQRFARARVPLTAARRLALMPPPAWVFFHTTLDPRSATRIRAESRIRSERLLQTLTENKTEVTTAAIATAIATGAPRRRQRLSAPELLRRIIDSLEDGKAEGIVTIDLAGKTTIADFMVVASGRSARQVVALADHLEQSLPGRIATEGKAQGDWVLIDAGDVIVHIFRPDIRTYYNLEKMWGEARPESDADGALDTEAETGVAPEAAWQ
jgi:nicotinate-nucleotide adenylyltransferase